MDETDFKAAIPKSALGFYVKLYCKKRKSAKCKAIKGHTVLMEATKSWLSLSKSEKDVFIAKYNNALAEYNKKVGEYLKNAEPYLKKRDPMRSKNLATTQTNIGNQDQVSMNNCKNSIENIFEAPSPSIPVLSDDLMSEIFNGGNQEAVQESCINNSTIKERLPEPTPPSLKYSAFANWLEERKIGTILINNNTSRSAKELFEMLARKDDNSVTWESLQTVEKRRYQSAVLSIKRNYITSYTKFLESLSHEELYNYYVKNKDCK